MFRRYYILKRNPPKYRPRVRPVRVLGVPKAPLLRRPQSPPDPAPSPRPFLKAHRALILKPVISSLGLRKKFLSGAKRNPLPHLTLEDVKKIRMVINRVKHPIHCFKRGIRRNMLFKNKIAGKDKRKSPGSGGTYKRTEESKLSC